MVPRVHGDRGGAAPGGERGDHKHIAVPVRSYESTITVERYIILEEPDSDIGVAVRGQAVAAKNNVKVADGVDGGVGRVECVFVRHARDRVSPTGNWVWIFGAARCEVDVVRGAQDERVKRRVAPRLAR